MHGAAARLAAEVDAWLDRHWATDITVREWWRRLVDAGLAFPEWPDGLGPGLVRARPGRAGDLDRTVEDVLDRHRRSAGGPRARISSGAVPVALMLQLAREYGRAGDPTVRQELVRYLSQVRVNGWMMRRIGAARGARTGADGSIAKLSISRICQQSRELSYRIVGAHGVLAGPTSPVGGELQAVALASPGNRIGGGTDEIQLDVLGERGCGLPREPSADRDIPYRELEVGTRRRVH